MEQLFEVAKRLAGLFAEAAIDYRLVGGMAVYLHVQERDPLSARLTRDIDVAIGRVDLERIAGAARSHGFEYRHAAGVDMLVDAKQPGARSAVHFVFVREKVRDDYLEAIPDFSEPTRSRDGLLVAPVADLVRMKLTSFRLKDQVHVQDMDAAGLITPAVESSLPPALRERLAVVRASD